MNNKNKLILILTVIFSIGTSQITLTAAKEASSSSSPSEASIRTTLKDYVAKESKATGTFNIIDPTTGQMLNLKIDKIHQRIGRTGDLYYSCADFTDTATGKKYDLDLDVADTKGKLDVVDVKLHKEDGKPRFTYDTNDNRIPLNDEN